MFAPRNCTPGTTGPPGTGATSLPTTLPPSTSSADSRPMLERSTAKPPFSTVSDPDCSGSLALAATARKIPTSTATASVATLKRFSTTIRTPLPCCRVEQRRRRLQPKPLATGAREPDCSEDGPLDRLTERSGKVDGVHALHDVRVGAPLQHRLDQLRILGHRQHRDLHLGVLLAQLGQAGQPVHLRHSQVEEDEIRLQPLDEGEDLSPVRRLPDDLEPAGFLERTLRALDH